MGLPAPATPGLRRSRDRHLGGARPPAAVGRSIHLLQTRRRGEGAGFGPALSRAVGRCLRTRQPRGSSMSGLRRAMGFRDVALFFVVAVVSPRWIASAAAAGPGALLVWLVAAITLFL